MHLFYDCSFENAFGVKVDFFVFSVSVPSMCNQACKQLILMSSVSPHFVLLRHNITHSRFIYSTCDNNFKIWLWYLHCGFVLIRLWHLIYSDSYRWSESYGQHTELKLFNISHHCCGCVTFGLFYFQNDCEPN